MLPFHNPLQAVSGSPTSPPSQARQEHPRRRLHKLLPKLCPEARSQVGSKTALINRFLAFATRAFRSSQQRASNHPGDQDNSPDKTSVSSANPVVIQHHQSSMTDQPSDEAKSECRGNILAVFPDIDPDHLAALCENGRWLQDGIIEHILNQQESGHPYPKAPKTILKRKREEDDDDDHATHKSLAKKFDSEERRQEVKTREYFARSYDLLQQTFPQVYMNDLKKIWRQHASCLYPAYLAIDKVLSDWDPDHPPFNLKIRYKPSEPLSLDEIDRRIQQSITDDERDALVEFRAARAFLLKTKHEAAEKERERKLEEDNFDKSKAQGNIAECGCCFTEYALNRMVHCDGDLLHWFCRDCARSNAETQIGLSRHHLECMSIDGCNGGFAMDQREVFLDDHSKTALDRIEQEAVLREAGIENLETCPFCPFAMEYPPIEKDKEFRCLKPDCRVVSCRACRKETHIPKTCEEVALEHGHTARHVIEEAMSEALIRKCNKCSTSFIKENGCNKMSCPKCRNLQCYICSQSCDYAHFNDIRRGGKEGNCPLFDTDGIEARHFEEVKNAETAARSRVLQENSKVDAALLEFRTSKAVQEDEERRKRQDMAAAINRARGRVVEAPGLADRMPIVRQRVEAMEAHRREAHQEVQRQLALAQARAELQAARAPQHNPAPVARVGFPVGPQGQQLAQPAPPDVHGFFNAPAAPPPAIPWYPHEYNGMWDGLDRMNPMPHGLHGAVARMAPEMFGQRTNPFVDQGQFGVANQAPHRNGTFPPVMAQSNPGMYADVFFNGVGPPWQEVPFLQPMFPMQLPHGRIPFPPPPQPQAQDWHHVPEPNGMPLVPPAVDGEQQNLGNAGTMAGSVERPGFQPGWEWNDPGMLDLDLNIRHLADDGRAPSPRGLI